MCSLSFPALDGRKLSFPASFYLLQHQRLPRLWFHAPVPTRTFQPSSMKNKTAQAFLRGTARLLPTLRITAYSPIESWFAHFFLWDHRRENACESQFLTQLVPLWKLGVHHRWLNLVSVLCWVPEACHQFSVLKLHFNILSASHCPSVSLSLSNLGFQW